MITSNNSNQDLFSKQAISNSCSDLLCSEFDDSKGEVMSQYYDWDGFKNIYLEDSFVISIEEDEGQLSFVVEIVLHENHPLYKPPHKNEQYCYKMEEINDRC